MLPFDETLLNMIVAIACDYTDRLQLWDMPHRFVVTDSTSLVMADYLEEHGWPAETVQAVRDAIQTNSSPMTMLEALGIYTVCTHAVGHRCVVCNGLNVVYRRPLLPSMEATERAREATRARAVELRERMEYERLKKKFG